MAALAPPPADDGMKPGMVLDTNVWLDWLVFGDPVVTPLQRAVGDGRVRLLATQRGRDELADVLARPVVRAQAGLARRRRGLAADYDPEQALRVFDACVNRCAAPPACGLVCRDPDDQDFIDLAVAGQARWLISKDRALLNLARQARRRHALEILPPAAFHEALDGIL